MTTLFLQVVARDVAYDLIPFMQRCNLHARLAEVLSEAQPHSGVPATTVAYHWAHSCKSSSSSLVDIAELPRVLKVPPPSSSPHPPHPPESPNPRLINVATLLHLKEE